MMDYALHIDTRPVLRDQGLRRKAMASILKRCSRPWFHRVRRAAGNRGAARTLGLSVSTERPTCVEHRLDPIRILRRPDAADTRLMQTILTPAVAYDGTHGFSDQYLVELPVFLDCAREAIPDPRFACRFPRSELATLSLNFFTAPSATRP
jgi:hypothetical protein